MFLPEIVISDGTVPVRKAPCGDSLTLTLTVICADGAGSAVRVNEAFTPSVTGDKTAAMVIVGNSLTSVTVTVTFLSTWRMPSLALTVTLYTLSLLWSSGFS